MITLQEAKSWPVQEAPARFREIATNFLYDVIKYDTGFMVRMSGEDAPPMLEFISPEEFVERFDESWAG